MTGILPANEGEIRFRGERIDRLPAREIARRGIARTFQHVNIIPSMMVLENAAIGAHLRGSAGVWSASLRLDRIEESRLQHEAAQRLDWVGLGSQLFEPAGALPLGSQRLIEVAGLRYLEKQALADLVRRLRQGGVSVLLVEHDMEFVMGLVDHIVVMNFGEKLAEGSPPEIQKNPAVIEAYLGSVV
jgi:branched-chain amino acid transport system permease protein